MSKMAEQAHDQDQRDNESGMDLCEAYHYSLQPLVELEEWDKLNARISEGFNQIFTGNRDKDNDNG